MVKIYGHYALIEGDRIKTTFYRHLIHSFDITALDGKDKDTAYNFTRKLYNSFVLIARERVRSAAGQLPHLNSSHLRLMLARRTNRS